MKIKYIAEDGTEFENMQECADYEKTKENNIQYLCSTFHFYRNGHWQTTDNIEDLEDMLYSTLSTHIKLERDLTNEEAYYLYKEFGYRGPTEEGLCRWSTEKEEWIRFGDELIEFCRMYPMITFNYKNAD